MDHKDLKLATDKKGWTGWSGSDSIYNRPKGVSDEEFSLALREKAIATMRATGQYSLAVAVNEKGSIEGWACGTPVVHPGSRREEAGITVSHCYMISDQEQATLRTFSKHGVARFFHTDHGDNP